MSLFPYGGEPLTNLGLVKHVVDYARRKEGWNPHFHLDTNGTLMNEEVARFLADNDFFLQISLDGPQSIHDRYRVFADGRGTFETALRNIKALKKLAPDYFRKVCLSATSAPPGDLVAIDKFFCDEFEDNMTQLIYVNPYDTVFFERCREEVSSDVLQRTNDQLLDQYIALRADSKVARIPGIKQELVEKAVIRIHSRRSEFLSDVVSPPGICLPGSRRTFVTCDGRFFPCERVGEQGVFQIGDVDEGISYDRVRRLIEEFISVSSRVCLDCWAQRICSDCYGFARKGDSVSLDRKKESCSSTLRHLDRALVAYASIMERNLHAFDFVKDMVHS